MVLAILTSALVTRVTGTRGHPAMFLGLLGSLYLIFRFALTRARPSPVKVTTETNTDCVQLTVVSGTIAVIEAPEPLLSSPAKKSPVSDQAYSPLAATTPSEESRWVLESSEPEEIEWYYLDLSGRRQGPYSSGVMRRWYDSGFLSGSLLVAPSANGKYRTLSALAAERGAIPFF